MSVSTDMDFGDSEKASEHKEIKLYKRRWLMLLLCFFLNAINDGQVPQYMIIAHIITEYYNVSYVVVTWTSLVFLISSALLSMLGGYIVKKVNLRNTILLSLTILCLSSWIRLLSVSPERFWIILLTQTLASISETIVLVIPSTLSSTWFGPQEISSSCGILMFGSLVGVTTTTMISQELVHTRNGKDSIEKGLYGLTGITVGVSTILLILMFFLFKATPPTPPSQAQLQKAESRKPILYKESLKQVALNRSFWFATAAYSIAMTTTNANQMFMNRNVMAVYPDANMDVGRISAVLTVMGMIGVVVCGYALDRSKHYKAIVITVYACGTLSMFALTYLFDQGIVWTYILSAIFGFFMFTPMTIRYDMSAELCYPVEESVSGSVIVFFTQISSVPAVYIYTALLDSVGRKTNNLINCGCLVVGFVLLCCVRFDLKRRKVNQGNDGTK